MSLAVGARVGPYEILGSLGAGGMGEVYRARDPRLDRAVAIKIVTASRDISPAQTERFLREARAIGRISHPHICTLHDVGQQDDVPFLVMELLEGPTLAERIEQGPVPVGEAVRIASQIARALDGAHRSGVIHRDLKPSNVMLTASGVKLLDFGPDARNLGVDGARILSISSGGDMAILFGPQTIARAFGTRTLARIPMAGGARRDLLGGVVDADWIPGTDSMAVVRDPGGGRPWTVEFPTGTPVHEAPAAWSLRVSPDGNRVAFFEGPAHFSGAPVAMITVIDRSGTKSTLTRNWSGIGVEAFPGHFAMTPDAETYCYSYMRRLGDLFVVEGLR